MSRRTHRHVHRGAPGRRAGAALVAVLVALGLLAAPAAAAGPEPSTPPPTPGAPEEPPAEPSVQPSVHYTEVLEHADDELTFTPGRRVEVGFRPRAADRWPVGGGEPRPLPVGRVSGADMAESPQGSRWAVLGSGTVTPDTTADASAEGSDAAGQAGADTTAEASAGGLFREVFGFLPYWELNDPALDLDYSVLSTIAYFSVGSDRAGNLEKRNPDGSTATGWAGWTSSRMTQVIEDAHRSRARVVLTITAFAWTSSGADEQAALLGSPSARVNLARQAAAAVRDRGADGINLDFEPIVSGYDDEFTALVRSVRTELDAIAPGYQLTFDTTGFIGNYPIEAATAPGGADAIFIMGYDFRTAGSATSGSIAPLQGQVFDVGDAVAQYVARVPASKLILGVPYYGRVWSTQTDQPRSTNVSGARYGESSTAIYTTALSSANQHGRRWDPVEASPYTAYIRENCTTTYGCVASWRQLWYDDAQSLALKYDLVNDRGLRGAGIWALGYDNGRVELDQALASRFLHDTNGPVAGINFIPWRQRDAGFVVGWSGRDVSGIERWDVQVSAAGGAWVDWLRGSTETSGVFLASSGVGYAFRVRATDGKGNVGPWDVTETWRATPVLEVGGFAGVRTQGLTMRAGPSTSAASLGTLSTGQILSLVDGPVSAGGQTWWEAVGPLREWRPVGPVTRFWVAQGSATAPHLVASRVPSSTIVDAVLREFSVGSDAPGTAPSDMTPRVVSPNGDGRTDTISIRWTNATALERLDLRVLRADGSLAGTIPLTQLGAGPQQLAWDGRVGGSAVADGTYVLALAGTADGVAVAAPSSRPTTAEQITRFGVAVDTTAPTLHGSASTSAVLSPNGDGTLDQLGVSVSASEPSTWRATVTPLDGPAAGTLVRSTAVATGAWTWDGRGDSGAVVADGRYRIALLATDAGGNTGVRTWSVVVDTVAPTLTAQLTAAAFSPNGDGVADTTTLTWASPDARRASVQVVRDGVVLAEWQPGASGTFTWDGRDASGRALPDGGYTIRVVAMDAAGNLAAWGRPVVMDRTLARVAWTPALFLPHDGDALARTSTVSFELSRPATTTVRILTRDGRYVRTAWSNRSQAAGRQTWSWDGRAGTGHLVARGWYQVVVTARSSVSTTTLNRLVLVDAFTATPSSTEPAAGETLTLDLRTAEPLSSAPSVTLRQTGLAPVTRTAVAYASGRYRVSFVVAAAPGPATLSIVARDVAGGTNSQAVALTVR